MKTKEYREQIAEAFLHLLEEPELYWKQGWKYSGIQCPVNARSGYGYKGINRFYLFVTALERGYSDPRWATFHQIEEKGWRLHDAKGQGVKVEYWFPYDTQEKKMVSWQEYYSSGEKFGERYLLRARYSVVFNGDLIEGIPPLETTQTKDELVSFDRTIETLQRNMQVEILNDGEGRAFYRPSEDKIHLPQAKFFETEYEYNATALHELAHATGAPHRLNRNLSGGFGTKEYAFEELIAEISSCFMSSNLQVQQSEKHIENHKAYVQGWVKAIREEPEVLTKAVQQAEQVANYMEYQAELITKKEYEQIARTSMEVRDGAIYKKSSPTEMMREIRADLSTLKEDTIYLRKMIKEDSVPEKATTERKAQTAKRISDAALSEVPFVKAGKEGNRKPAAVAVQRKI